IAWETISRTMDSLQSEIDDAAFAAYMIAPEDRALIEVEESAKRLRHSNASVEPRQTKEEEDEEDDEAGDDLAVNGGTDALFSWLVGAAFCRFDVRLATGERGIPPDPEPFDPVPVRSPGMFPMDDSSINQPDILVDDEGHQDDLAQHVHNLAERVHVDAGED